jgi:TetR/AcrR family transcriptional regulator
VSESAWLTERLPAGHHGLSPGLVAENQRRRLSAAAAESLAERGYGAITTTEVVKRAGVSTSTFYKRFDDLWDCLLAAYEAGAERLCGRIEGACAARGGGAEERATAGIDGALALLAAEPALAHLLSTEPPSQANALWAARLRFSARLVAQLRSVRETPGGGEREARLVGGALALVSTRARADGAERLRELAPALKEILLGR